MIVMLNGAFGVGKSTVAEVLLRLIPDAFIFDPESVGSLSQLLTQGIRSREEETDDFQDIRIWSALSIAAGCELYLAYRRPMIVPMTLVDQARLAAIRNGLEVVAPVAHFCLLASWPVIQSRLIGRESGPGSWPWRKSEQCAPIFFDPAFATHIDTEQCSPDEIAGKIMQHLKLDRTTT